MLLTDINSVIAKELKIGLKQVESTVKLLEDGNTVPFIARYRKESEVTYALGATVVMEYLNNRPDLVTGVILHPQFRATETIDKINTICKNNRIEVSTEEKPFNILSQKENCFVIGIIKKHEGKLTTGNHVVLVNPSNAGNMGTIMRSSVGFDGFTGQTSLPALSSYSKANN